MSKCTGDDMRALLIAVLFLLPAGLSAQYTDMYTRSDTSYATTTWTKVEKGSYRNIFWCEVSNDTTAGTQKIFVGFSNDTTDIRRFSVKAGEVSVFEPLNVTHVYIRSSSGSIPYRIRYH
jgi:hypothetical protein